MSDAVPLGEHDLEQLPMAVRKVVAAAATKDNQGCCRFSARAKASMGTCALTNVHHHQQQAIVFSRHVNHLYLLLVSLVARGPVARLLVRNEALSAQQQALHDFAHDDGIGTS